jgi:hypothetical protein
LQQNAKNLTSIPLFIQEIFTFEIGPKKTLMPFKVPAVYFSISDASEAFHQIKLDYNSILCNEHLMMAIKT